MCTVTLIARRNGHTLGMNRDEKLTRAAGLPPRLTHLNGRTILAPSEPGGGTWIGVNDTGATLALVNWYSITARVAGPATSRGEVVKLALPFDSPALVEATLKELPLAGVNPFRLIGVYPTYKTVVEWRWNLQHLERRGHLWRTNTWISSGFDEPGVQQTRGKIFGKALRQASAGRTDWLRRLHRSHGTERGPYSTCMHREDAETVSYTEVTVSCRRAKMRYTPGTPCCTVSMPSICLNLTG